ncbi:hypothetical protein [Halopiger djelfimassiliensis]|uniref:hypothetical protein n=1 Tax=Halopiger djelfimassiliensis TaxID=1293047 RepID=UPI000677F53F|nr:hypothetical protein [Halopiger djelfimassiliensis]
MRTITILGVGFLAVGTLLFVAAPGAIDSITADRGAGIDVADDGNAFVGLEYPDADTASTSERPVISLESDDGALSCGFFSGCSYEYSDIEVVTARDQGLTGELTFDATVRQTGTDPAVTVDEESLEDRYDITATVECDAEFVWFQSRQTASETTLTVELEAADETFATELERSIDVECVPD